MPDPRISIIVPVFNAEKYLHRCISSILNQTLRDIQAVIINDHSTDDSSDIIKEYQEKDSRIIFIENETNLGVGKSRNLAIENAIGKYLLFIDSDDWIEASACEKLLNLAESKNLDVLEGSYNVVDDNDVVLTTRNRDEISDVLPGIDFLQNHSFVRSVWNRIYKREFIQSNHIKFSEDISYGEDVKFSFDAMYYSSSFLKIDFPFYNYYQSQNSLSRISVRKHHLKGQLYVTHYFMYYRNKTNSKKVKSAIDEILAHSAIISTKLLREAPSKKDNIYKELYSVNLKIIRMLGLKFLLHPKIKLTKRLFQYISPALYNYLYKLWAEKRARRHYLHL